MRLGIALLLAFFLHVAAAASQTPVLSLTGDTLSWQPLTPHAVIERKPGPTFIEVSGVHVYTPAPDPGHTDTFRERPRAKRTDWSNEVSITWPEVVHEEEHHEEVGACTVTPPLNVPTPASGWHVIYADAFCVPLGSGPGQDSTLVGYNKGQGCCGNSNEVAVNQASQSRVGSDGLELVCTLGTYTVEGVTHQASCGAVRGDAYMEYADANVGEWAVEVVAKWPVCSRGADPGFWIFPSESSEIDFFEGWCWPTSFRAATTWATAEAGVPVMVSQGRHEIFPVTTGLGFDPSLAFHRYATAFVPEGNGKYDVGESIDGVLRWQVPGQSMTTATDGLILSNGLRENVQADVFTVRSVALWQDAAHAGQGIRGGGVAPGTTVK